MHTTPPIGTLIGPYILCEELGEGGVATIHRVRHRYAGTDHALKLLHTTAPSLQRRLRLEGRIQATLRHPNVLAVQEIVEWNGLPGLVMAYVDGPTLEQASGDRGLPLRSLDRLARGLLAGVEAIHDAGYAHRDLKPANVLLERRAGRIVPLIADFGLARPLQRDDPGRTRQGVSMGTPAYMAPEQVQDAADADHRADLWSLGAMLYELATGHAPFTRSTSFDTMHAVVHIDPVAPRRHRPDLPRRVASALTSCLRKDRDQRPASVAQLREQWFGLTRPTWTQPPPQRAHVPPRPTARRSHLSALVREHRPGRPSHLHALARV